MSTDPICGMNVDETSALRAERDGQTFYYTCPMHAEVQEVAKRACARAY